MMCFDDHSRSLYATRRQQEVGAGSGSGSSSAVRPCRYAGMTGGDRVRRPTAGGARKCGITGMIAGLLIAVACACLGAQVVGASAASSLPNIILITADTFRPDFLGYYGRPGNPSPVLDSLAREGASFSQAYSSSGWTTPGLLAVLTGLDALGHGVDIRGRSISTEIQTLPDVLRQAGYTAPDIFFLTDIPNFHNLGFESYPERDKRLHDGDEVLFHWLREIAEPDRPFFLYYHYRELHLPFDPGEPYESMYLDPVFTSRIPLAGAVRRFLAAEKMRIVQTHIHILRNTFEFSHRDRPWLQALYDAQIKRMDTEFFGRLRQLLQEEGLTGNTLIIVSADHGEELLEDGLIGHVSTFREGRLYEPVIRIPLIFWFPGVIEAGQDFDVPVQDVDIMPTVLELAGLDTPSSVHGQSLVPLMTGAHSWSRGPLFFETSGGGYTADPEQYARRYRAIRAGRWKLHHRVSEGEIKLFDLDHDPREKHNLATARPEIADSLRGLLDDWVLERELTRYVPLLPDPAMALEGVAAETPDREPADPVDMPAEAVEILFPQEGDTLRYLGDDRRVQPRWTGPEHARYIVEYAVGDGDYHLSGEFVVDSSAPQYGPFSAWMWDAVVLYNPFTFRIYPDGQPDAASPWTTFYLEHSTGTDPSALAPASLLLRSRHMAVALAGHTRNLIAGFGHGGRDLYLLIASVPIADLSVIVLIAVIAVAVVWTHADRLGPARCRAWGMALLYIAFVYTTIPVMPVIWHAMSIYTDGSLQYLANFLLAGFGVLFLWRLWSRNRLRRWQPYVALALVVPVYAYLLHQLAAFPAVRLHLVLYGFMSWVLYSALRLDLSPRRAYLVSLVATALLGLVDECIQWVLPQRFFDIRDVQLNALAGALGLLVLRFVVEPERAPAPEDT